MKKLFLFLCVLWIFFLIGMPVLASDVYRWTDPETGKVLVTPSLPQYPIVGKRNVGKLPSGDMIELTFDANDPQIKALSDKRKAREADQKRIAAERQKEQEAKEEEKRKIAEQKEKEQAAIKDQERRMAAEKQRVEMNRAIERARILEEKQHKEAEINQAVTQRIAVIKERSIKNKDIGFIFEMVDEFLQFDKFASTTPRINLAIPIEKLLSTKMKLNSHEMPVCYSEVKKQLLAWMSAVIQGYYEFAAQNEASASVYRESANSLFNDIWLKFPDSC